MAPKWSSLAPPSGGAGGPPAPRPRGKRGGRRVKEQEAERLRLLELGAASSSAAASGGSSAVWGDNVHGLSRLYDFDDCDGAVSYNILAGETCRIIMTQLLALSLSP